MKALNVLVVCECSGTVREAFRALGHNAWSCDLKPAEDGAFHHLERDALDAMNRGVPSESRAEIKLRRTWDLFIMHPPCTYLNVAGIHWNNRGRGWDKTDEACKFTNDLVEACGKTPYALENPVGILSTRWRKPDEYVQPYRFGDDASKNTGLWLQGLPRLRTWPKERWVKPRWVCPKCKYTMPPSFDGGGYTCVPCGGRKYLPRWANQTDSGQNKLAPGPTRATDRARTYPGIARAMAEQWIAHLLRTPTVPQG